VWNIDIDFDHPESTIEKAIDMQEAYYRKIGMPIDLQSLGVRKEDLEAMTLGCSRNKTRTLKGDKPLGYDEILDIFKMAYER
jgi:hypothetical protein